MSFSKWSFMSTIEMYFYFLRATEYGIRYCAGIKKSFGWDFNGSSNLHELDLLLKAFCLVRRVKADVLNQLPAKVRFVVL